ncbi:MAG TPA: pyrroline-5-carboxylate reductase dimerization domain-containing protein, partial [Candidatus Omnitrophota bacterium]|nr:pyrroline-5-carboxylate reductase dimerization domain-containing protein [Candidatus Omnitrophota bacterium]
RTALGAAKLLIETGHEPGVLRGQVTSKGGTTEQAIKVFEKAGFKRTVRKAVAAAVKRSRQLSGG